MAAWGLAHTAGSSVPVPGGLGQDRAGNGGMLGQQWQILAKEWNPIRHPATVSFPLSPTMWVHKARTIPGPRPGPSGALTPKHKRVYSSKHLGISGHLSIFRGRGPQSGQNLDCARVCLRATQRLNFEFAGSRYDRGTGPAQAFWTSRFLCRRRGAFSRAKQPPNARRLGRHR